MRSLAGEVLAWGFDGYDRRWEVVARAGVPAVAVDTRLHGSRYVSLNALVLSRSEAAQLRRLTECFGRWLDHATAGLLDDAAWWSELAWPWPALELARHEPVHPGGRATLYGRFDWLMEAESGRWQLVEYNADTPSGGREVSGLEPAILRLHGSRAWRRPAARLPRKLAEALLVRLRAFEREVARPVGTVGVVSSHSWLEDMAQAWWLAGLLRAAGQPALVGDVADLAVHRGRVLLRGRPVEALYRFYPVERLYRHGVFAPLHEAAVERRLLLLNGLRGFLAQSKATLAWLWEHRGDRSLGPGARETIEAHLPAMVPARDPSGADMLADAVVKHVNGREGDMVTFGETLVATPAAWEERLLEGGYVVQRRVRQQPVADVVLDEPRRALLPATDARFACVGAFCIGGRFGGCYTRLDGPITSTRASFVPTVVEREAPAAGGGGRQP